MVKVLQILACAAMFAGFTSSAGAQEVEVEGRWVCVVRCQVPNGRAWIEGRRRGLVIYNEVRDRSRGHFVDEFTLVAVDWDLTGRVSRDGETIYWSNGMRWIR